MMYLLIEALICICAVVWLIARLPWRVRVGALLTGIFVPVALDSIPWIATLNSSTPAWLWGVLFIPWIVTLPLVAGAILLPQRLLSTLLGLIALVYIATVWYSSFAPQMRMQ